MKNKNFVRLLCLLLMVAAVVGVTAVNAAMPRPNSWKEEAKPIPSGLILEDMPIVLPGNATGAEKSAAKELQHYLREMTGSASAIVSESTSLESAIYIGATKFAAANDMTIEAGAYTDDLGTGEGWVIKAIGDNLVLTGGEKGVLYSVYHLLEDEFGIRWWNMWEEYVPTLESAVLPYGFESKGEPKFAYRDVYVTEGKTSLFFVRNRLNGFATETPAQYGGEFNFAYPYHVHTLSYYFPAEYEPTTWEWRNAVNPDGVSWFKEHPEWFSWSASKQQRISYGQLCLTNEELLEAFKKMVLVSVKMSYEEADAANVPRPMFVNISPNDMAYHCECADCLASRSASGESGHLLKFVNEIAAAVAEVYPEIKVETIAYWHYFETPLDDTVPAENVVLRLANSDLDLIHDVHHPNNAQVKARIDKWAQITNPGQLMLWDYALNGEGSGVLPGYFRWFADYRYAYEKGFTGIFTELESANDIEFWDLKLWLLAKAIEDPYQDVDALVMEFLNGYYGEAAAEALYGYLQFMDAAAEDCYESFTYMNSTKKVPWLNVQDILKGNQYFEDAIAGLEADETLSAAEKELFINRINAARCSLDRCIVANYTRFSDEAGAAGIAFGLSKREVAGRMVDSLTWLRNMEREENYTGLESYGLRASFGGSETLKTYKRYATETDPVSGEQLERPAIPQQVYDDHPGLSDAHIYDFKAVDFWIGSDDFMNYPFLTKEYGAASWGGTAVVADYNKLYEWEQEYGAGDDVYKDIYAFSETKPLACSAPGLYLGDPLINDGEYHLYYAPDTVISDWYPKWFSFMYDSIRFTTSELNHMIGKPLDVYLSMKIEGDPSFTDLNNLAKIYIDRVIVVEDCTDYDSLKYTDEIAATCANNKMLVGLCPVCGQEAVKEVPNTRIKHNLIGDYRYDSVTGKYYADCAVCGEAALDFIKGKLPDGGIETLASRGTTLEGIIYDCGLEGLTLSVNNYLSVVDDEDSALGQALQYDMTKLPEGYGSMFRIPDFFGRPSDSVVPTAKDIIADGEYHLYVLPDIPLVQEGSSKMIFCDWTLQFDAKHLDFLMGQKVDVYISMKVEGDMGYFDGSGDYLRYYIDRLIVAKGCTAHNAETYEWDEAQQAYVGKCVNCGFDVRHSVEAKLPQDVLDTLAETKSGLVHAYNYKVNSFALSGLQNVADEESVFGRAAMLQTNKSTVTQQDFYFQGSDGLVRGVGTIAQSDLSANIGKGYQIYKFDDVQVPTVRTRYIFGFDWGLQNADMAAKLNAVQGKTVDVYISMKVTNGESGVAYYVDRMILVDSCKDHMSNAVYDAATGMVKAQCTVCGRYEYQELVEEITLPEIVQSDLSAVGAGEEHANDYNTSSFSVHHSDMKIIKDEESVFGTAAMLKTSSSVFVGKNVPFYIQASDGGIYVLGSIALSDLKANVGKGYHIYKFDNVELPNVKMDYVFAFEWYLRNYGMATKLNQLKGKTVDAYVSMKVTGDPVNGKTDATCPSYYIDRIILVDNCLDYEIEYTASEDIPCTATEVVYTGNCPVCGKEFTKSGAAGASHHSFTTYAQDPLNSMKYVAYCDYGCGTTDVKNDRFQAAEESLPEELPESVRKHLLFSYNCKDYDFSGIKNWRYWDVDLDRPVGVLDCATNYNRDYAKYTDNYGFPVGIYSPQDNRVLGEFKNVIDNTGVAANAGRGYQLFAVKNVVPIKENVKYRYSFMLNDWVFQILSFDEDMIAAGYVDKSVDLYLYAKIEGDPTLSGGEDPAYYFDQLIVTSTCVSDDTWKVTTEPTCDKVGYMEGICAICGEYTVLSIPKLPHVMKNSVQETAPTCVSNEFRYGKCEVCGVSEIMEVPNSNLEHSFSNYQKRDDGTEVAYCDNGCGEWHTRNSVNHGENLQLPENIQQILPVIGKPASHGVSFSDIKSSDWYFSAVKEAVDNKLINGVTATEFRPDETLTTAQAIKLASAYHEMNDTGDVTLTNGSGNWYSSYVDYAVENSIVDSDYASMSAAEMNKPIDRSEFVAIFEKAMGEGSLTGYNTVADNAIPDVKTGDANAEAIYKFYRAGILTGSDGKGTFNPHSPIKRSEVATILSRMFNEDIRQSITLN